MNKVVAIVHFNTPELTKAGILSLRKHGGIDYRVVVFDNSDTRPFTDKMPGVEIIDNTKGQIIDFAAELAKYPGRENSSAGVNDWGSDKHMWSIQKLWELIPEGFGLMDSDVLIKSNIDHLWQSDQVAVGHVQAPQPGNLHNISRLVPILCFINVPLCNKCGLSYFDPKRSWMLYPGMQRRENWYDTGASFLEDIHNHKNGAHGRRIDIRPLMEHYKAGSWQRNDPYAQSKWLEKHRDLWEPTPQMRGEKRIAICAIGRNENLYAREWVEHYQKIGVSKIFIYDNYHDGEEKLSDVLSDFVDSGFVDIKAVPNRADLQCKAYEHCYKYHGNEFAWIGFLDFDEFLRWKGRKKIEAMFAPYEGKGDVVQVNWRLMSDNGLVRYDDRPLAVRFPEPMPLDAKVKYDFPENCHVKSFVRGGLKEVHFGGNPHNPSDKLVFLDTHGNRVKGSAFVSPYDHSVMRLDHYWTKTAEEWVNVKLKRGFPSPAVYMQRFETVQDKYFFAVNERTPEKEEIIFGYKSQQS